MVGDIVAKALEEAAQLHLTLLLEVFLSHGVKRYEPDADGNEDYRGGGEDSSEVWQEMPVGRDGSGLLRGEEPL